MKTKKQTDCEMSLTTALCGLDDLKMQNERLTNELSVAKIERDKAIKLLQQTEASITYIALKVKIKDFFDYLQSNAPVC